VFATEKAAAFPAVTVSLAGCVVTAGAIPAPAPEIATVVVEFEALLVIVRSPEIAPSDEGANFMTADVLCPAEREIGKVALLAERPVPDTVIWLIFTGAVPVLVIAKL
jgi:hypothetical protein